MANLRNVLIMFIIFFPLFTSAQLTYPTKYPNAVIPHNGKGKVFFFGYAPMIYIPAMGGGLTHSNYFI